MKKILTVIMVLTIGVFANAQYLDLQRSQNLSNYQPNVIRPAITNDLSYLGAAYTLGSDPGNLTGEYGRYMQLRLERIPAGAPGGPDISTKLLFFEADGTPAMVDLGNGNYASEIDLSLRLGVSSTIGLDVDFNFIMGTDLICFSLWKNVFSESEIVIDANAIGAIGGYIDYVAISGSGYVSVHSFKYGNGWIDDRGYGFTNMETIRGQGISVNGDFIFGSGRNVTYTSKALAWNAKTGAAMRGQFTTGGPLGLMVWDNLTFTFGSFERVSAVPGPRTGDAFDAGTCCGGFAGGEEVEEGVVL